ncbi:MAG: class I SAM-dependent methyltransferase [Anaerolineae bacterium]|nr:class I SAM-dependent methyltransferase [Anaerolineae bacterium]
MSNRTIATYNRIANTYASANQDRSFVAPFIDAFTAVLSPGQRVVDIGCGPGFDTEQLRNRGYDTIGIDLSPAMLTIGRKSVGGAFVLADMGSLPFGRIFDGILANASLLHIPRSAAPNVITGFHRVLRTGGVLGLAVKQGNGENWSSTSYGYDEPRFFTYWQPEQLDALLAGHGFAIVNGWSTAAPTQPWLIRIAAAN